METKKIIRTFAILALILSNIGCDQISKDIVRQHVIENTEIGLINNYLVLTRTENTGAFLSLGDSLSQPLKLLFLNIMPMLVLLAALVYVLTKKDLSNRIVFAICCITGGGIGNLYDRAVYGSVTDFLHIDLGLVKTGIFNMADMSIMAGMFIILAERALLLSKQQA